MKRYDVIRIIATEPECPGPIPFKVRLWTLYMAFWNPAEMHRLTIRITKQSIKTRIYNELPWESGCEEVDA